MNNPPSPNSPATLPVQGLPPINFPQLVALALIMAAVVAVAWIAAWLIKDVAAKALEKADTVDVPVILKTLATWIPLFGAFLRVGRNAARETTPALRMGARDNEHSPEPPANHSPQERIGEEATSA